MTDGSQVSKQKGEKWLQVGLRDPLFSPPEIGEALSLKATDFRLNSESLSFHKPKIKMEFIDPHP